MKYILRCQIEHKENEYTKKDKETTLISFFGDKAKWIEGWKCFESSIHKITSIKY